MSEMPQELIDREMEGERMKKAIRREREAYAEEQAVENEIERAKLREV